MLYLTSFVAALFAGALVRHVGSRLLLNRLHPRVQLNLRRMERAKARVEAIDTSMMSETDKADLTIQYYEEEGGAGHPLATLFAGQLAMWVICVAVVWYACLRIGGPFAEAVWWVPWTFLGATLVPSLLVSIGRGDVPGPPSLSEARELGLVPMLVGTIGCGVAISLLAIIPLNLLYSLAPVGVVTFTIVYWCVSWVLWRLFPYSKAELPKVAMLFL